MPGYRDYSRDVLVLHLQSYMVSYFARILKGRFRKRLFQLRLSYDGNMYITRIISKDTIAHWQDSHCQTSAVLHTVLSHWFGPAMALTLTAVFGLKALIYFYAVYIPAATVFSIAVLVMISDIGEHRLSALDRLRGFRVGPFWLIASFLMVYFTLIGLLWHVS